MFEKTQWILKETESYLLDFRVNSFLLNKAARWVWFPLNYLLFGLRELFKPIVVLLYFYFFFFCIGAIFIEQVETQSLAARVALYLCLFLPIALVIFAVPSTYALNAVEKDQVVYVSKLIHDAGINTLEKIELLEQNIESIFSRINSRVTFYKWFLGVVWAISVFQLNIYIGFISKIEDKGLTGVMRDSAESLVFMVICFISVLVIVQGYKRASEKLIKTIEFAAVERKAVYLGIS